MIFFLQSIYATAVFTTDTIQITGLLSKDVSHNEMLNGMVYPGEDHQRFRNVCQRYSIKHPLTPVSVTVKSLPPSAKPEVPEIVKSSASPKEIVRLFLEEVRSGAYPDRAALYMADTVLAHQVNSENPVTVKRTPANYTAHVKEFLALFGRFEFSVTELMADGDKVYARWTQKGTHQKNIDQYKATGLPLVEYTSAVYRIENGKIAEYWLQSDRLGMEAQLRKNALLAAREH